MPSALVFGGTYGIGAAICRRLAETGFDLAVNARRQAPGLVADLRSTGVRVQFFQGDLSSWPDVQRVTSEAAEALGGLDVVVVSGKPASAPPRLFLETDAEDFDAHLSTMAVSRLYAARAAAPLMRERGRRPDHLPHLRCGAGPDPGREHRRRRSGGAGLRHPGAGQGAGAARD